VHVLAQRRAQVAGPARNERPKKREQLKRLAAAPARVVPVLRGVEEIESRLDVVVAEEPIRLVIADERSGLKSTLQQPAAR